MAVDYEEGRRLLAEVNAATVDEVTNNIEYNAATQELSRFMLAHAEALLNPDPWRPVDFEAHLTRQRAWSEKTFGPGARLKGVVDHIRKELLEIEADPLDLGEWVDVIILAFDGAWRAGWEPADIIAAILAKQAKNEARVWPDWRTADPDKAIEHDRSFDPPTSAN